MTKLIDTNEIGGANIIDRTKSIFNAIHNVSNQPFQWLSQGIADTLDQEYYLNHSGDKNVSPLVEKLLTLTGVNMVQKVANIIINKFEDKWTRLYNAFIDGDYEPLENYSMEEVETPNITRDITEKQKTKIETETTDDKTENEVYGFNSATPVPSGDSNHNGTITVSGDENENKITKQDKETGTRSLTRHGNIGVTTSQQMLESEIKLRENFLFFNMLFKDVDSVMTLLIY